MDYAFAKEASLGPRLVSRLAKLETEFEECDFFGPVVKGESEFLDAGDMKPHQVESICDAREATIDRVKAVAVTIKELYDKYQEANGEASASQ